MQYDDFDLPTMERNAWQRGDVQLARLIASLEDDKEIAQDDVQRAETERDEALKAAERTLQDASERQRGVENAIEALDDLLKSCKRLSNRAAIEEAVQAIYNAATGA